MKQLIAYIVATNVCCSCHLDAKINAPERPQNIVTNSTSLDERAQPLEAIDTTKKVDEIIGEAPIVTTQEASKKNKATTVPPKDDAPKMVSVEEGDKKFYFEGSNRLSVKETPWTSDKKRIFIYGKNGHLTYEIEDVRMSYQSVSTVNFRKDGSVESIDIHENPGASRYWYETHITFSEENMPLEKSTIQYPMDHLSIEKAMIWDPNSKTWIHK